MNFGRLLLMATVGTFLFLNYGCKIAAAGNGDSNSEEKSVEKAPETKYSKRQLSEIEKAKTFLKESDFKNPTREMVVMACVAGDLEALKKIKKNGCRWFNGPEPILAAAEYRRMKCCKFLIKEGADVNARDQDGITVLHHWAFSGNAELCKNLVSKGADVKTRNQLGMTALHYGARSGSVEVCQYLVSQGADVKAKDNYGGTVLHTGAESGSVEVCQYLISQGADVNARNQFRVTVLHAGAFCGSVELCKYLVSQGADVNVKDNIGKTALDCARKNDLRQYLISQGAKKGSELQ